MLELPTNHTCMRPRSVHMRKHMQPHYHNHSPPSKRSALDGCQDSATTVTRLNLRETHSPPAKHGTSCSPVLVSCTHICSPGGASPVQLLLCLLPHPLPTWAVSRHTLQMVQHQPDLEDCVPQLDCQLAVCHNCFGLR